MDPAAVLAAYDEQVRRHPAAATAEYDDGVVRAVGEGWRGVLWSGLDEHTADAAIARQIERFADGGGEWEWKHYSYDRPADLPDRLLAAGFAAEPPEALMVAEIAELELDVPPPDGVELVPVRGEEGVARLVRLHDRVFGGDHAPLERYLLGALPRDPPPVAAVLAMAGSEAVSGGRVEFRDGTDFAGLWGGGTLPEWRRRGIFRALVAHRAALAAERGFRYLQVDASPDSRPILARLGFAELATTTPFVYG